jgi:hypothetical protein
MATNAGVLFPKVITLSFAAMIGIGIAMLTFTSIGIENSKSKRGGKYRFLVIGLIGSIVWTIVFAWKFAQASGANKLMAAQGARLVARSTGAPSTNATLSGATS